MKETMKTVNEIRKGTVSPSSESFYLASCRTVPAQIERTKSAILAEYRELLESHQRLLHLALNEAEALAWQTDYPHFVFPVLAAEKAQALVAWHARQQSMRANWELAFAA